MQTLSVCVFCVTVLCCCCVFVPGEGGVGQGGALCSVALWLAFFFFLFLFFVFFWGGGKNAPPAMCVMFGVCVAAIAPEPERNSENGRKYPYCLYVSQCPFSILSHVYTYIYRFAHVSWDVTAYQWPARFTKHALL